MRALVLLVCVSLLAAPAMAVDPMQPLGVLPIRVKGKQRGKAKRRAKKDARLYFNLLVEVLQSERGEIVPLRKSEKEQVLNAPTRKRAVKAVRARTNKAGLERAILSTLSGKKLRQVLEVELFDVTGHSISKVRVKPYDRPASTWVGEIITALQLVPAERPGSGPLVSVEPGPALPADEVMAAAEPSSAAGLWWTVGAVSFGTLSAASLAGGAFAGASAWDESETLVALPRGDQTRVRLEESSLQKAMLADALFGTGAILAGAAIASGIALALTPEGT